MRTRSPLFGLVGVLLAFSLLAAACAGDDEPSAADPSPAPAADDSAPAPAPAADDDAAPAPAPAADDDAAPAPPPAADDAAPADDTEPATAADAAPEPMVIGPPEVDLIRVCAAPSFTQMYAEVMVSQGFLSDRGTDIEFVACLSGPAQAAALVSKQVDIA